MNPTKMISARTEKRDVMESDAISRCIDRGSIMVKDVAIMMSVFGKRSCTPRIDGIVSFMIRR
jgi:hypothetical protein